MGVSHVEETLVHASLVVDAVRSCLTSVTLKGVIPLRNGTVYPGITDDGCVFRELQLGNLGFHTLILQSYLLYEQDLFRISRPMDVGT